MFYVKIIVYQRTITVPTENKFPGKRTFRLRLRETGLEPLGTKPDRISLHPVYTGPFRNQSIRSGFCAGSIWIRLEPIPCKHSRVCCYALPLLPSARVGTIDNISTRLYAPDDISTRLRAFDNIAIARTLFYVIISAFELRRKGA